MKSTYTIQGMTCSSCENTVRQKLLQVSGVQELSIDLTKKEVEIESTNTIPFSELQKSLQGSKYSLVENAFIPIAETDSTKSSYAPLFLVFAFIIGISFITSYKNETMDIMLFMNHFMAGFFIVFSFFKLLNLRAFADSYAMYDIIAKKIPVYGYIYPFIELLLGIAFLTAFNPLLTNIITLIIMGISSIGVIESVINKKKIQCACLGTVFNLPMSSITIVEDLLMVGMSLIMILILEQ
jgi:copper chaperone CopZ